MVLSSLIRPSTPTNPATLAANVPELYLDMSAYRSRIGLIAGAGLLPHHVALNLARHQADFVVLTFEPSTLKALKPYLSSEQLIFFPHPGLIESIHQQMQDAGVKDIVFAGKINKWTLLRSMRLDKRAKAIWQRCRAFTDDTIMGGLIEELEIEGYRVLPQSDFIRDLFIRPGLYSQRPPTDRETQDITLGLELAKEMGRLDVGQTVIISQGMIVGIEAIEGTDQAIRRCKPWIGKAGGVVVKVEKPNQDKRFDIPTVGPRTLASMRHAGLNVLAIEAHKTLAIDLEQMTAYANRHQMTLTAL